MSFAGTLLCCGVGGLIFKYGDQKHEKVELPEEMGIQDYTIGFAQKQFSVVKGRFDDALKSILPGFSTPGLYLYPFRAYWEVLKTPEYWKSTIPIMILYGILYILVTVVYALSILPVYTPISVFLGPLGLLVAWVHMFLHTNMLTMMSIRMSQMNTFTMSQALKLRKIEQGVVASEIQTGTDQPVKYYYSVWSRYYLLNHLPWKMGEYLLGFAVLCVLLAFSAIPIVGPIGFNVLVSPVITRIYWAPYLRFRNVNNLEREQRFYKNFGHYTAFGATAALVESIPVVSAFAYAAHAIAICDWAQEEPLVLP